MARTQEPLTRCRFDITPFLLPLALGVALAAAFLLPGNLSAQDNPHGDMDRSCADCHTIEGWTPLKAEPEFDHAETGFPLAGSHREVACLSCHADLRFQMVPTSCVDCHEDPHRGENGFDCDTCHLPAGWENRGEIFDRHSATLFPLTGSHAFLDCESCHREPPPFEFANTPIECFACHVTDYGQAEPDHLEAGFPIDCEVCHTTNTWLGADFDHEQIFPLNGAHRILDCIECHEDGYAGTPTDCYDCHQQDYNSTTDPNHVQAGFPMDCEECHDENSWQTEFDHDEFFVLTGAHRTLDCEECHADGFTGTPTDCYECHMEDYNGTTDPNHVQAGFSMDCEDCHGTSTWEGAVADHPASFPLQGGHGGLDCQDCHADGFEGTPTDCYACHRSDYEGTTDPNHASAGFSTMCEDCHDINGWEDADFDHNSVWPLTGGHRNLDCDACHADGFDNTPTDCFACHEADYNNTSDPDHADAGFPTMCEDCHNTSDWNDADFDHNSVWPLTGGHRNLDCEECHADGFDNTPTDCFACHESDYNNTNDPDHAAAGFPTDCEACHNTSDWDDADFDHNQYFPLTGDHGNLDCDECHVVANNFQRFECIECHEHNQADMADEHDDVGGYVWESQACYDCHPDGRE